MMLPLHLSIFLASGYSMFVAWGWFVVAFFSMHYHIGAAFGFWDHLLCIPRQLDLSAQIAMSPVFAWGLSRGNAVFTLTCILAAIVPLLFVWWPTTRYDGRRWQSVAVLGFFVTSGLVLHGRFLSFAGAAAAGVVMISCYAAAHFNPYMQVLSRLAACVWTFIVCVDVPY